MFCNKCGKSLHVGSKFCDNCGNVITSPGEGHGSPKNLKRIVIFSAIVLLIIFGFLIVNAYFENNIGTSIDQSKTQEQLAGNSTTSLAVTSINPATVIAPYENIISIKGSGFQNGVTIQVNGKNLELSGSVAANLMYVKYPGNFAPGTYDLVVVNPDGGRYTLNSALTIKQSSGASTAQGSTKELTSAQIVNKLKSSVVLIRTDFGCGSGMVIKSDGTILTDNHVINGAKYISVYLSGGAVYTASVVSQAIAQDLALIKINATNLSAVNFGDSNPSSLELGASVIAIGYPLTCNYDQTLEADPGIVTARRTSVALGADAIQTSARINPGDSGGPLVDDYGNVIGINESIYTISDLDLNVTGIAFATPSEVIKPFINNASLYSSQYSPQSTPSGGNNSNSAYSSPTNPRYFQVNVSGICQNAGNGTILLIGYPYVNGYSIPPIDIDYWGSNGVSFTVPSDVTAGTYRLDIRGYQPGIGYCADVNGGNITVQ